MFQYVTPKRAALKNFASYLGQSLTEMQIEVFEEKFVEAGDQIDVHCHCIIHYLKTPYLLLSIGTNLFLQVAANLLYE